MHVNPALRALRDDPVPQRQAQAQIEAARRLWLAREDVAAIAEEFGRYAAGMPLAELPVLERLLTDPALAGKVTSPLVAAMCRELAARPFAQVPFRHQYAGGVAVAQLMQAERATLSLLLYEAGARPAAETACFDSGERVELCLSGSGDILLVALASSCDGFPRLTTEARRVGIGDCLRFDNQRETKVISTVAAGGMVVLRLSRAEECPAPAREFRLVDGKLVHQASGDRAESRAELAMALLGAMGRRDVVPEILEQASEGTPHLRWQALRHSLALDPARGFVALCSLAQDSEDDLSGTAAALRARLIEIHPQLAQIEDVPCPA